jgi:hypothetical protein
MFIENSKEALNIHDIALSGDKYIGCAFKRMNGFDQEGIVIYNGYANFKVFHLGGLRDRKFSSFFYYNEETNGIPVGQVFGIEDVGEDFIKYQYVLVN